MSPNKMEANMNNEKGFFAKLKEGLSKTKKNLTEQIEGVIFQYKKSMIIFLTNWRKYLLLPTWVLEQRWTLLIISKKKQKEKIRRYAGA